VLAATGLGAASATVRALLLTVHYSTMAWGLLLRGFTLLRDGLDAFVGLMLGGRRIRLV
jgi:hypothetical protein